MNHYQSRKNDNILSAKCLNIKTRKDRQKEEEKGKRPFRASLPFLSFFLYKFPSLSQETRQQHPFLLFSPGIFITSHCFTFLCIYFFLLLTSFFIFLSFPLSFFIFLYPFNSFLFFYRFKQNYQLFLSSPFLTLPFSLSQLIKINFSSLLPSLCGYTS